jgi:hypothetical protein
MAILHLESIECLGQAEFGNDELYVTFNGTKTSLPNMNKGQTKKLKHEFMFNGSRKLSLFENDGNHWYDRDDFIASQIIDESPKNVSLGFIATSGNALGANYILNVTVTSNP